jgi:DMSO/TMAO reductase YedYZ molybdopterin-dependent catalytic subunit
VIERIGRREMMTRLAALPLPFLGRKSLLPGEEALPWADIGPVPPASGRTRFTDLSRIVGSDLPSELFFVLRHGAVPAIDDARYRLRAGGELEHGGEWGLAELRAMPKRKVEVAFECAGNGGAGMHGLVSSASWGGIALRSLLEPLGVRASARDVVFEGADDAEERLRGQSYPSRFARSLDLDDALGTDVLLAYEMNGEPLAPEHGSPLRLIVPGWYGVAQVKWVERITVLDHRFMGWYMAKDYVTLRGVPEGGTIEHRATSVGRQRLKSLVTRVTRSKDESGSIRHEIQGLVWNDGSALEGVDLSVDDGPFRPARVEPRSSPYAWTSFSAPWDDARPGRHRLVSRARDARGSQPTEEEASRYKATPWENDGQVVREIVFSD